MYDRDDKLFKKVCLPIYKELFKKSEPSGNFNEMMKSGETKEEGFFYKYYMPQDKIDNIINKHLKRLTQKLRIRKYEKNKIRTTILFGCSPTSSKERWEKKAYVKI